MIVYRTHKKGSKPEDKKYVFTNHRKEIVKDKEVLEKIRKMAIPPAYKDVKINLNPCAKIIYEGFDDKGRRQQIYSAAHNKKAKKAKFCRLIGFGKAEPKIRADIKKYMKSQKVTKNKIISLLIAIIWRCGFRVGNIKYQVLYGSHGISNIFREHMKFGKVTIPAEKSAAKPSGGKKRSRKSSKGGGKQIDVVAIEFKGKKGVVNKCCIYDQELVRELKKLVSGKNADEYVFTYKKEGEDTLIKATEINDWLGAYGKITSKDLRTFDVNVMFIDFMKTRIPELVELKSVAKRKKIAKEALILTSAHINNTPGICKSSYLLTNIYEIAIEKPRTFKKHFGGPTASRVQFINFLEKVYC